MTFPPSRSDLRPPWMPDLDTLDLDRSSDLVVDGSPADSDRRRDDRNGDEDTSATVGFHLAAASPPQPLLHTPAHAAALLAVNESWLRRRAAARAIACTFLGKHLRFSPNDLHAIIASGAQQPASPTSARRRTGHRAPAVPTADRRPGTRTDQYTGPDGQGRRPPTRRRSTGVRGRGEGVASWRG